MTSTLRPYRQFDVVVYGCTGFTGNLVAEYVQKNYAGSSLKWAIAGRNEAKLLSLKSKLGLSSDVGIFIADSDDQASIDKLAQSTNVILSATGPFALKGTSVVDACVRCETNYCDITGESLWIRSIIDKYHDQAVTKKLKIVNCCGFDCVPSDMGVMMVASAMAEKHIIPEEIRYVMKDSVGGASGGTISSVMNIFDSADNQTLLQSANPYFLTSRDTSTGRFVEPSDAKVLLLNQDTFSFHYDKYEKCWEMPWFMQSIDTRIVHRSNALSGWKYGRNLVYRELMAAPNVFIAFCATALMPLIGLLLYMKLTRNLIKMFVPQPGEGPNTHMLENGYFKVSFWGRGKSQLTGKEEVIRGVVSAVRGDPGYKQTAKFVAESAIALALDHDQLPSSYGILTPSVAIGNILLERLRNQGIEFSVHE